MTKIDPLDTIVAAASPPGPGVLGLIRIAGPDAAQIARIGWSDSDRSSPSTLDRPNRNSGHYNISRIGRPISGAITCWPGSRNVVGQPLAEIQTSGSPPVVQALVSHFLDRGARLAESGEFTLRSFLSGRIDLIQAEAVMGVVDAANLNQLDSALRQLAGGLTSPIRALRDRLVDTLAHLEANLDFAEEPDVNPVGRRALADDLAQAAGEVSDLVMRLTLRTRVSGHPRVVLSGPPNVGKSRLFNALIGLDHALVADEAGTTRDYVEAETKFDGVEIRLVDTAGIDDATGTIAEKARSARLEQTDAADVILECRSAERASRGDSDLEGMFPGRSKMFVLTKTDILPEGRTSADPNRFLTSANTGFGLDRLKTSIARRLREMAGPEIHPTLATSARCSEGLTASARSLVDAADAVRFGLGDELIALDLRRAIDDLGRVVGLIYTDDLLDTIFRRFCIGK